MNRIHRRYRFIGLLIVAVFLFVFWQRPFTTFAQQGTSPDRMVQQALALAQDMGSYTYSADMEQTMIPRATTSNIGHRSERIDTRITGQVTFPDYARLSMLFEGAGKDAIPLTIEQDGNDTYLLMDGERTLIENPAGITAPGGDYTIFLQTAANIRLKPQSEPTAYTIYEFDIDGPRLAQHIADLTKQSSPLTVYGIQAAPSALMQKMDGQGELWIGEDGLPLRQIMDIHIPEMSEQYDVQSHMVINFHFNGETANGTDEVVPNSTNTTDSPPAPESDSTTQSGVVNQSLPSAFNQSAQEFSIETLLLVLVLLVLFSLFVVVMIRHWRLGRIALPISLVLILLFTPIVRMMGLSHFSASQVDALTLAEALGFAEEMEEDTAVSATPLNATVVQANSSPTTACGTGDLATDTDQDGIDDFTENCLGTDAYYFDSDRDLITDTLEIEGFMYAGEMWYSNPAASDTNGDGMADIDEWEYPIGYAPEIDPDNDGIPNLWDDDNDGDGVPDDLDLDPFSVTAFEENFSLTSTDSYLDDDSYQYIELQIQPEDLNHLRFTTTYLDWPFDFDGTMQDLDQSTEDVNLLPMLKIAINNAPSDELLEDYGVVATAKREYWRYNTLYVTLTPVSDGGQITAFNGKVAYDNGDNSDIQWDKIELIWVAQANSDTLVGDEIESESSPIAIYEENFRLTGLQVSKSSKVNTAVLGTPATPNDNRDLLNVLMGLDASFLTSTDPDLAEIVDRFTDDGSTLEETWGVPATAVSVSATSSPLNHSDEMITDLADRVPDFLDSNSYPTNDLASLIVATEADVGAISLDSLDSIDGNEFTFNINNFSSVTMRSLQLTHFEHDGSSWDNVEIDTVMEVIETRYADLSGDLSEIQAAYPDLEENDLLYALYMFYTIWTAGDGAIVAIDGESLSDETISDSDIYDTLYEPSINSTAAYIVEATNIAELGSGLQVDTVQGLYNYLNTENEGTLQLSIELIWVASSKDFLRGAWNTTWISSIYKKAQSGVFTSVKTGGYYSIIGEKLQASSYRVVQGLGKFVSKYLKGVMKFAKWVGVAFEIAFIWIDYGNFHSIYDYEYNNALAYAISATIAVLVIAALTATVFGSILVGILLIIEAIVQLISGGEVSVIDTIAVSLVYWFYRGSAFTTIDNFEFRNLSTDFKNGESFQVGTTMVFSDEFIGILTLEDGGISRLENSTFYGFFDASADSGISVVKTRTFENCYTQDGWWSACFNDLEAEFSFDTAQRDATISILYKTKARVYYEECILWDCSTETENVTLPNDLESEDRWDSVDIVIDILPETVDELWNWSEISNPDVDGDDLSTYEEILYGTDPNDWDSDDDGLSDGFEASTSEDYGADPMLYDTDGDGLNDGLEYQIGTIISDEDSDNDGRLDGEEYFHYNGASWEGGGWFIDINGTTYWTFSDPNSADADGDSLNDGSEHAAGLSPYGYNDAPQLLLSAEPWEVSPTGETAVFLHPGDPISATVNLNSYGAYPITTTLSLCAPALLLGIRTYPSGDRLPPTQTNGDCSAWDFSGNRNLQIWEQFEVEMTATSSGSNTVHDNLTVSLPYPVAGITELITATVPFVVDDTNPEVFITDPIENTMLNGNYYVLGGTSSDADSWVDHVELILPNGTFTATGTSPWAYTWELPDSREYTIHAVAYDAVGNASAQHSIDIIIDSGEPVFTIDIADGATISSQTTDAVVLPFSGTVTDDYSGLTYIQMRLNERPWETIWHDEANPLFANWSGTWEIPVTRQAQGDHVAHFRAYDVAGNVTYFDRTITVDTYAPTNEFANRVYLQETPPHVPINEAVTLYGIANDSGNDPLAPDPAELMGTLDSITDATIWLQPDSVEDNDSGVNVTWIGDFNGDRLGDLAVGLPGMNGGAGQIFIIEGEAGDWSIPNLGTAELLSSSRSSFIGETGAALGTNMAPAGDANGDGFADLLIGDPVNNRIFLVYGRSDDVGTDTLLEGDNPAKWAEIWPAEGETIGTVMGSAGDVNNDSLDDMLIGATNGSDGQVYMLFGDATPPNTVPLDVVSAATIPTSAAGGTAVTVGDVNNDTIADFAVATGGTVYLFAGYGAWGAYGRTAMLLNEAMGTFATSDSLPIIYPLGDANNDGIDDFVYSSGATAQVVFGNGSQSWSTQALSGSLLAAVGDVNADGLGDLLLGNSGDAELRLGGNLTAVAATLSDVASAAPAPYIAGADLNGDGSSDLLVVPDSTAAAAVGLNGMTPLSPPFISADWLATAKGTTNSPAAPAEGAMHTMGVTAIGDAYVGTTGEEFSSIQAAIDDGATRIIVRPGIYQEVITLTSGISVIGAGADRTYLTFPADAASSTLVNVEGSVSNAELINFTLVGNGTETGLLVQDGANNISLSRSIVRDMGTGILVDGATADLEVRNNTILGNVNGMDAANCASVDVRSTIFAYNTGTALEYDGCASVQLHTYNNYWGNGTDLNPLVPGSGELFLDPLFIDIANNDFRTEFYSPIIDAGAPGDPVPPGAGDAPDIGHMEQSGASFFADSTYCDGCVNDGLIWDVTAFATIQEAVDAAITDLMALSGADALQYTVGVGTGVYNESVVISSSVKLLGSGPDLTTIQGVSAAAVTFDAAVNAGVSQFTLIGGGGSPIGVDMRGGSNTIDVSYNLIKENTTGVALAERATGEAQFNTIVSNTTGIYATEQYGWMVVENNILSNNNSGVATDGTAQILSDYNLFYNTTDHTNVVVGVYDMVGQDPLLTSEHQYLTVASPAVDAAQGWLDAPLGGGSRADLGWHELLAAPISLFLGQPDASVATANSGVAQVEYALVEVADASLPVTATLPTVWNTAVLNNPNATYTYWQTDFTPTNETLYRIYSRATDGVGNVEDEADWYDGAFEVDATTAVVTGTTLTYGRTDTDAWPNLHAEVLDASIGGFDVQEVYFNIDGVDYPATWDLEPWVDDGVTPRSFHMIFADQILTGFGGTTLTVTAVAIDGAGIRAESGLSPLHLESLTMIDIEGPAITIEEPTPGITVTQVVTFSGLGLEKTPTLYLNDYRTGVSGYELSFDSGVTWHTATGTPGKPDDFPFAAPDLENYYWEYVWQVPSEQDSVTFPVRIRAVDNVGNTTTEVITVTVDNVAPTGLSPVTFDFEPGYHFDNYLDLTTYWHEATDGSGTAIPVFSYDHYGVKVPGFEVTGTQRTLSMSGDAPYFIELGVKDASGNLDYEVYGPWYIGAIHESDGLWINRYQSIGQTFDGEIDLAHNEWVTATEWLDDDPRTIDEKTQSLYAAWEGEQAYLAWDGAQWSSDGTLWAYWDILAGGTTQPVGVISHTLPMEADIAISIEDENTGWYWTYNGSDWISETLHLDEDGSLGTDPLFAHNAELGQTEVVLPTGDTRALTSHKMLAFAVNDAGDVWSAFPILNELDGPFDYYFDWDIAVETDLFELPLGAQTPYVPMEMESPQPPQSTYSSNDILEYVVTLTNLDNEDVTNLQMMVDGSSGLSYQSVDGATCAACPAGNDWLVDIPTLAMGSTHLITITAQLDSVLTSIDAVTSTMQLTTTYPLIQVESISHLIDSVVPSVTINTLPGNAISSNSQLFVGTADDGDGIGVAYVEIRGGGGSWQQASGTTIWSDLLTPPASGSWQVDVRATDYHSQTGAVASVIFNVDTTPPTTTVTIPALLSQFDSRISGQADDPAPVDGAVSEVWVQLDNSGNSWQGTTLYGDESWLFNWALPYEDGVTHTLRVSVTDSVGNTAVTAWQTAVIDTVPPELTVTETLTRVAKLADTAVLSGSVTDGFAVARVPILIYDATNNVIETEADLNGNQWSYVMTATVAGEYSLWVTAEDTAGNSEAPKSYSVEVYEVGPGGIIDDLSLWLKADAGIEAPINGGNVVSWTEQMNGWTAVNSVNSLPTYNSDALNFNPAVTFGESGASELNFVDEYVSASGSGLILFAVVNPTSDTGDMNFIVDVGQNPDAGYGLAYSADQYRGHNSGDNTSSVAGDVVSGTHSLGEQPALLAYRIEFTTGSEMSVNGVTTPVLDNTELENLDSNNIDFSSGHQASSGPLTIGQQAMNSASRYFQGDIAEVIIFSSDMVGTNKLQVESYLALKYGITLDSSNYLASDGGVVWDATANAAYHHDVAGIGWDDMTALNQPKSQSINDDAILTIANGNSLSSPTPLATDRSFLVWGNDDVALSSIVTETINSTRMTHLERTWRVQESGTVTDTAVSFNLNGLGLSWVDGDVALLIDDNTDFSDATLHTTGRSVDGDEISFTNVDFNDGDLFTLVLITDKTLTVTTENGRVTSDPAGIDCGTTCAFNFTHGTVVTLTAVADEDYVFTGWSGGGCSGSDDCVVTMTEAVAVTAVFEPDEYLVYLPIVIKP